MSEPTTDSYLFPNVELDKAKNGVLRALKAFAQRSLDSPGVDVKQTLGDPPVEPAFLTMASIRDMLLKMHVGPTAFGIEDAGTQLLENPFRVTKPVLLQALDELEKDGMVAKKERAKVGTWYAITRQGWGALQDRAKYPEPEIKSAGAAKHNRWVETSGEGKSVA